MGGINSVVWRKIFNILNPTLNYSAGIIQKVPKPFTNQDVKCSKMIRIAKLDWNSYETSWDFTTLPLLQSEYRQSTLKETYTILREHWREMTLEMPGLILANQAETVQDYLALIPEPTFEPDDDNVIPIMDVGWFPDDIADRFKQFLKITFGEENYAANNALIYMHRYRIVIIFGFILSVLSFMNSEKTYFLIKILPVKH